MKVASIQTLTANRKTRIAYAMDAIERDSYSTDSIKSKNADAAFNLLMSGNMTTQEQLDWAIRNQEWLTLNH